MLSALSSLVHFSHSRTGTDDVRYARGNHMASWPLREPTSYCDEDIAPIHTAPRRWTVGHRPRSSRAPFGEFELVGATSLLLHTCFRTQRRLICQPRCGSSRMHAGLTTIDHHLTYRRARFPLLHLACKMLLIWYNENIPITKNV
jgi:hypothetical protein